MWFFNSKSDKKDEWKKSLINDMVLLTGIDGEIGDAEKLRVLVIALELGFSESEFIKLLKNIKDIESVYPTSMDDKILYLVSLLRVAYADGIIANNEIALIKILAKRMDFPENAVEEILSRIEM